jgi:hypothetical protein
MLHVHNSLGEGWQIHFGNGPFGVAFVTITGDSFAIQ